MQHIKAGLALATTAATIGGALAQESELPPWTYNVTVQADHEFDTDIDSGGSFEVTRASVETGVNYSKSRRDSIGLALRYRHHGYDFGGTAGFGSLGAWSDIQQLSVGVPYRWGASDNWDVFAVASVTSFGESGADFGDTLTGSAVVSAIYRVSDSFSIGPGLGVSSEIEDDVNVFPFLVLDWQITDDLKLSTRSLRRVVDGPQATLAWQAAPAWSLAVGSGYESYRFRLDDSGANPDGVGEESGYPACISVTYGETRAFQISAFAGYKLGGELTLENSNGNSLASSDYDPAPFVGASLRLAW